MQDNLKAVVERPILESLGKANLQRVTGPAAVSEVTMIEMNAIVSVSSWHADDDQRVPGVIRQPQVVADDMLQQPAGGLLGQCAHHGHQSHGRLEETTRDDADELQPELV